MLTAFIAIQQQPDSSAKSDPDITSEVMKILHTTEDSTEDNFFMKLNAAISSLSRKTTRFFAYFKKYIQTMAKKDDTWKFWTQFLFEDAMAYVGLYLATRSGDWDLLMISIKKMAPLFAAFDHLTYQKLIANHIQDVLNLPKSVLLMFKLGAFVVNICGREWHSVGIDEAHRNVD